MSDIEAGSEWVEKNDKNSLIILRESKKDNFYVKTSEAGECYISRANLLAHYDLKPKHSHYKKDVRHIDTIDIYWICDLYVKDDSGCIQHAVKKLLCCGERGVKDNVKDLQEAIDTIQRKIEILKVKGE